MTIDKDILINRVVDQEASDADWRALHALAASDAGVWRELAQAQRDHASLCGEVEAALSGVDRVDVPSHEHYSQSLTERVRVVVTWSGWVAAAAIMLAWTGVIDLGVLNQDPSGAQTTGMVAMPRDPEESLDYYIEEGRRRGFVVGEVPEHMVLDIILDEESGDRDAKIVYLRQIVEIRDAGLFMHPSDELGRPDLNVKYPVIFEQRRPGAPD